MLTPSRLSFAIVASLFEQRDGADWARGAAADFQRKADEAEAAATNEFVQVVQALHVRDATFRAGHMRLEIQLSFRRRTDRLDPEHADAAIGEPMHRCQREARKVVLV